MNIVDNDQILSLGISPEQCVDWVKKSFLLKDRSMLPPKISLHPQASDFLNTMPCLSFINIKNASALKSA